MKRLFLIICLSVVAFSAIQVSAEATVLFSDNYSGCTMTTCPDWKSIVGRMLVEGGQGNFGPPLLTQEYEDFMAIVRGKMHPSVANFSEGRIVLRNFMLSYEKVPYVLPNAAVVFSYFDKDHYRFAKIEQGPCSWPDFCTQLTIEQIGEMGGEPAGKKAEVIIPGNAVGLFHTLRIDLYPSGGTYLYLNPKINSAHAVGYRFAEQVPGKLGIRTNYSSVQLSVFDPSKVVQAPGFVVRDALALPAEPIL